MLPNFHPRDNLVPELLRKEGRCSLVGVTGSLWGFIINSSREESADGSRPTHSAWAHSDLYFSVNSLERRAPRCLQLKCPYRAVGYFFWHRPKFTYNTEYTSDTPVSGPHPKDQSWRNNILISWILRVEKNSCSFLPGAGRVFDSGSQIPLPFSDRRLSVGVCLTLGWQVVHTFLRWGLGVLGCVPEEVSVQSFIFCVWAIQFNYTHAASLLFIITLIHFNIHFPWLSIEKRFVYYLNSFTFMMLY